MTTAAWRRRRCGVACSTFLAVVSCSCGGFLHAESHSDAILSKVRHLTDLRREGDLPGSLAELEHTEKDLRPDDAPLARVAVLEARVIALIGTPEGWERARQYLDEAERAAEAATPELFMLVLLTRASAANTAQHYDEALATLHRLQAVPALKNFSGLRVQAFAYEAVTHHYMGQFEAAKAAGLAGLAEVARDSSPEARTVEARLRANLALTLFRLDERDEALRNAEAAIRTLDEHHDEAASAEALASAYLTRAVIRGQAGTDYDEALKLLEQAHGAQSPSLIPALTTKGWAMIAQGSLDEASGALERGIDLAQRNRLLPFFQLPLMENLACVRLRQHREDEGKRLAAAMRDIWHDWLPLVIDAGSETDRLNLLMQCHWVDTAIAAGDEPEAIEAITNSYGIVFDSLLREAALAARLPRDQRLRYRQNQARLAALALRPGASGNAEEVSTLRRLLHDTAGTPATRAPRPEDLPPGSALVVFAPYRTLDGKPAERLAAAVITDKEQRLVKLSATRDAIRSTGDALVAAIQSPGEKAAAQQRFSDLREALLTPLQPTIGKATTLYLCLDGCMNRVPATLWPNAVFLTSPQALLRSPPPARPLPGSGTWLLVNTGHQRIIFPSNQAFPYSIANAFKDHALPALPGAAKEIKALFDAQPERWAVLRSQSDVPGVLGEPSENVLVQSLADPPAVIHIAGHAALRDPGIESTSAVSPWWQGVEQPRVLWSSCLFFPDPQPADTAEDLANDNYLFAAEIAGLDLNGTKLVTLSACETGTGLSPMSEGHYSLARAFHSAGVRDVLSCTEPLPDASVAELMSPFYKRIARGDDAAKSFYEVQQRSIGDDITRLRQYGFFRLTRAWVKAGD